MIKNFRYKSDWDDFFTAVKILKELVKSKQAFFSVGFWRSFSLIYTDNVCLNAEIDTIISDEIVYLLRWYLNRNKEGKEINEKEIRSLLDAGSKESVSEEEQALLVKKIENKLELVKDAFDVERLIVRYQLKQDAVNAKLSDFNYNIYTCEIPNQGNTSFAIVDMECKKKLQDVPQGIEKILSRHEQGESITFICDEEDIDLMICALKEMKQKIKGES